MSEISKNDINVPSYRVNRKDLPVCCPTKKMRVWDMHPRIFLSLDATGAADCPYCGAHYILMD